MHAYVVYNVGMKSNATKQYTVRGIPPTVDKALRRRARVEGKSINSVLVESLTQAAGQAAEPMQFHDLDDLAGTWQEDPEFDSAIDAQEKIDEDLWK